MRSAYTLLYDGECSVCRKGVSVLRVLDRKGEVNCLPVDEDRLKSIHQSLTIEECLKQIHAVSSEGEIFVGWDALMAVARLFPVTRWAGAIGSRQPFRSLGYKVYRRVANHRYVLGTCRGGTCRLNLQTTGHGGEIAVRGDDL